MVFNTLQVKIIYSLFHPRFYSFDVLIIFQGFIINTIIFSLFWKCVWLTQNTLTEMTCLHPKWCTAFLHCAFKMTHGAECVKEGMLWYGFCGMSLWKRIVYAIKGKNLRWWMFIYMNSSGILCLVKESLVGLVIYES